MRPSAVKVARLWRRAYQGHHAPSKAVAAHNLGDGSAMSTDILDHPEWYTGYMQMVREFWRTLLRAQGSPNAKLTIYRALPGEYDTFNNGDWVTLSRKYAEQHAWGEDGWHIIEATVPAKNVWFAGDDLVEWGYWGPTVKGKSHSPTGRF